MLILVPRHFERFGRVKNLIKISGFALAARSKKTEVGKDIQVLLGDTIGELNFLYSLADIAFVGGSLIDHGGQNLLEPSAQSMALLSGPSLRNFSDISEQLKATSALEIVINSEELSKKFLNIMGDPKILESKGRAALEVFNKNRGALDIILKYLSNHLNS